MIWCFAYRKVGHFVNRKPGSSGKTSFKSFIFSGHESFVPDGLVEVLKKKMSKSEGLKYWIPGRQIAWKPS